jgi:hypothetical protein
MDAIGAPFQALVPEIAAIAADRRGFAPIPGRFAVPPELWSPTAQLGGPGGAATLRGPGPEEQALDAS